MVAFNSGCIELCFGIGVCVNGSWVGIGVDSGWVGWHQGLLVLGYVSMVAAIDSAGIGIAYWHWVCVYGGIGVCVNGSWVGIGIDSGWVGWHQGLLVLGYV